MTLEETIHMINLKEKLLSLGFFDDNEYLDFYCALIYTNLQTPRQKGLTEVHHKIPRKLYKLLNLKIDNSQHNLVNLTHFDHCLAHYYLCLCSKGPLKYSNEHAFIRMSKTNVRFENFDFESFIEEADKYEVIYKSFVQHQADLNKLSFEKRGGGTNIGKHSYTNGIINVFREECPEGFWPGRIVKEVSEETKQKQKIAAIKRESNPEVKEKRKASQKLYYESHSGICKGKVWITNDIEDTYIPKEQPLPEGWRYGRKKFSKEACQNISKGHKGLKRK